MASTDCDRRVMYMFWRSEDWTPIKDVKDDKKATEIVDQLGGQLAKAEGRKDSRLVYRPDATTETGDRFPSNSTPLSPTPSTVNATPERDEFSPTDSFRCRLVTTVANRSVSFLFAEQKGNDAKAEKDNERDNYKYWCVYRFTCRIDPNQTDELAGYLPEAAFFAVRGTDETGVAHWLMLDWTSSSLHRLNELAGLKRRVLSHQQWLDYLVFFVSYLGSSEEPGGLIHPFLIQSEEKEIFTPAGDQRRWTPSPDKSDASDQRMIIINVNALIPESADSDQIIDDLLTTFEEFAASQELKLFEEKDEMKGFATDSDPFDLPPGEKPPDRPKGAEGREQSAKSARAIVKEVIQKEKENPKWFIPKTVSQTNDEKPLFELIAPMTYRGALFEAKVYLYPNGMVRMVEDNPVPGAGWLPAPRWEVRRRQDGIHLLCLQAPRHELSVVELRREIREGELRRETR